MSDDVTIGQFRFGLGVEAHAHAVERMSAAVSDLAERGAVPSGTTYSAIADVMIDTLAGYAAEGPIAPEDFPDVLRDALAQLEEAPGE